jgi:hypothetical protein
MHSVLVLGGYGFFGQRICAALAKVSSIELHVAGRDYTQAAALVAALDLPTDRALRMDAHSVGFARHLTELGIDTLIHTAGPFQGQNYAVAIPDVARSPGQIRGEGVSLAAHATRFVGSSARSSTRRQRTVGLQMRNQKATPRKEQLAAIIAMRGIGKREAQKRLDAVKSSPVTHIKKRGAT